VSIFDTYRVVITSPIGNDAAFQPMTREGAMAKFNRLLIEGADEPWIGKDRIRVISEKVWIESQAVKR
jgi:hypothetical protein